MKVGSSNPSWRFKQTSYGGWKAELLERKREKERFNKAAAYKEQTIKRGPANPQPVAKNRIGNAVLTYYTHWILDNYINPLAKQNYLPVFQLWSQESPELWLMLGETQNLFAL